MKSFRLREYQVLLYRLVLVYLFYTLTRLLFVAFNAPLLQIDSVKQLLLLCFYGLRFDTTIILYVNSLFILVSLLPLIINTHKSFQRVLFYLYFITNGIAIAFNFIDFIYYKFTFARSTSNITESIANEQNKGTLLLNFMVNYWYVFLLFGLCIWVWVILYRKITLIPHRPQINRWYWGTSVLVLMVATVLTVGGIRGGFKKSTRPINLVDANNYVTRIVHADVVLNTPFCIARTFSKKSFKKVQWVSQQEIEAKIKPIKQYESDGMNRMNVVVIIMESFAREYSGAFNQHTSIENYQSYTPFLDSLATHGRIYDNAYTNGFKSIHAMPAVLAGIPSFKDAFTSSPYVNTSIESLVSILKEEGYYTSFFHGAPNGSMGFLGFSNVLGFDAYYGKTEYNNDDDFDGVWGIWDDKFFRYMEKELSQQQQPFFATLFSVSSHEPFKIPQEFEDAFEEGDVPIHRCIRYSDYALQLFFEEAAQKPWFHNTLFIITADHTNQVYYDEYKQALNRTAVPILLYSPALSQLQGIDSDWAQHIDIYPTVLDILGYPKPFRSWGRSLLNKEEVPPFVINFSSNNFQFMWGDYICIFDGHQAIGFYHKTDKNYTDNLLAQNLPVFKEIERYCQAFLQNYYEKIVDRNLAP